MIVFDRYCFVIAGLVLVHMFVAFIFIKIFIPFKVRLLCVDVILALSLFLVLLLPPSVFRRFSHLPQRPTFTNSYSIAHRVEEELLSGCSTSKIQK